MEPAISAFIKRLREGDNLVITGLGDSLTQGWMVHHGYYDRFIVALQQRYPAATIHSNNIGVPGSTAGDAIHRLPQVMANPPDLVIVQFGLNDCFSGISAKKYARNLETIASSLLDRKIPVVLVTSCPVQNEGLDRQVREFYETMSEVGRRLSLPVVQLDQLWREHEADSHNTLLQTDGVHPTDSGHTLMAQKLANYFEA